MINLPVLVLNQNYEPLDVCRVRRAMFLIFGGKAEMLENGSGVLHSATETFPIPSVIRLVYLIRRPRPKRKLTRFEIFSRDGYRCQYCGKETHHLTLDHVIPRYQGGAHTWENVVSACVACNRRKAGKLPAEAGMKLLHKPVPPSNNGYFFIPHQYRTKREWEKYLPLAN